MFNAELEPVTMAFGVLCIAHQGNIAKAAALPWEGEPEEAISSGTSGTAMGKDGCLDPVAGVEGSKRLYLKKLAINLYLVFTHYCVAHKKLFLKKGNS